MKWRGAEIFVGPRSLGKASLTVDLPLGEQTLEARHPDYAKRSESVMIAADTSETLAFQYRNRSSHSSSSHKPKPPDLDGTDQALE